MKRQNIQTVLERMQAEGLDPQDEQLVKYWIHHLPTSKASGYTDEALERVSAEMWQVIKPEKAVVLPAKKILWPQILVAAAAVVIVICSVLLYRSDLAFSPTKSVIVNDIAPGTTGATLTLANGTKIDLKKAPTGDLAHIPGIKIKKSANGQLIYEILPTPGATANPALTNTLSTANGETYKVQLPDGSMVWLNATSSISYSTDMNRLSERQVKLSGEAYFEVAKLNHVPFAVITDKQKVEVLGTHFNIHSYPIDGETTTTLLEGSVRVVNAKGQLVTLKPNQQAITTTDQLWTKQVNANDVAAWRNGLFVFQDESLERIMRKLARWYNLEVVYTPGVNKNELYYGNVSRYDNVSKILETLELTKGIHFKIEGRRVTLMK
jgi:hypothetical protein